MGFAANAIGLVNSATAWVNPWSRDTSEDSGVVIPSKKPLLLTLVSDKYSRARRNPPHLLWEDAMAHRENLLDSFPAHQSQRYLKTFEDTAIVFLPGLLNFFPSDEFFQLESAVFGHGGLVIGVSAENSSKSHHGSYSVVGGDERVIQKDWRLELPLVVKRLIEALKDPQIEASRARQFVFVGHSKGGFLVLALQALTQMANESRIRDLQQAKKLFPGLDQIPFSALRELLSKLKDSQFYSYGSPLEGIQRKGLVTGVDTLLLNGSARYFTPDFMSDFFKDLGSGPEMATAIIHAQKAQTLRQVLESDTRLGSAMGNSLTTAARALFHGAGHLIGAHTGDGLVDAPTASWSNLRLLPAPADHLQMVETPDAAKALLHVLDDQASSPNFALSTFETSVLSAAKSLVNGSGDLVLHLGWLLEHNPGKALAVRDALNPDLANRLNTEYPEDAEPVLSQIDELRDQGDEIQAQAVELVNSNLSDRGLPPFALPATAMGVGAFTMVR